MPIETSSPQAPPSVLPADFSGWDAAPPAPKNTAKPPATLPANFSQWDAAPPTAASSAPSQAPNAQYAKPGSYTTTLSPDEEREFQKWTKEKKVPWQDTPTADYDMRGYYKAMVAGKAKQALNPNDNKMHFPDTWKTPYHKSFSNESQYALPNAPKWNDKDQLVDASGKVVYDERASNGVKQPQSPPATLPGTFKKWDEKTPQQKILDDTLAEGYSPEQGQQRQHEYDYAVSHGMNPQRAQEFAMSKRWNQYQAKVMTQQEKDALTANVEAMTPEERQKQFIFGDPKQFTEGYAEAKQMGMSDDDAVQYGSSNVVQRGVMKAQQWAAPKWTQFKTGALRLMGARDTDSQGKPYHVSTEEAADAPLVATIQGKTDQDLAFERYKDASWIDEKHGRWLGNAQSHLDNLIAGFTTPDMAILEAASFGGGLAGEAVGAAGLEAKVPISLVKTIRTSQKLAHAAFTAQMTEGSAEDISEGVKRWKDQGFSEGVGYLLDGVVNGLMAAGGVHHSEVEARLHTDLNTKTGEVFEGKSFGDLNDQQQAIVINKLIEDDPAYTKAADLSEKKAQREARRLNQRHNSALQQAWHPQAAARAITEIHRDRAERARGEVTEEAWADIQQELDLRKAEIQFAKEEEEEARQAGRQERTPKKIETAARREVRQDTAQNLAASRQEVYDRRQEAMRDVVPVEGALAPREVTSEVDDNGHVNYLADYWDATHRFGVQTDGEQHAVYRMVEDGNVEWLDRDGNFTEEPEQLYWNAKPEAADTIARLSALSAEADSIADQPDATADQIREASELASIRRQLVDGEINYRDAQKKAGIAEQSKMPDEIQAAMDGKLNGPFHEQSAADYVSQITEGAEDESEAQALLEMAPRIARQQTVSNLNHVYRPGDYIMSKRGVRWTLDSKGMLHPDDGGTPVPLLKKGLYSNQVMQLGESGRIGYGGRSREQRRADNARSREINRALDSQREQVRREMLLAQQQEGLQGAGESEPRDDAAQKAARAAKWMGRPPAEPGTAAMREIGRNLYKAPASPDSVIQTIAKAKGVSPEEVMRQALANDPERQNTPEAKIARLEVGDEISDPFRKDRPWVVESRNGKLVLRSGQAAPLPLDRLNPSERILQIGRRGEITPKSDFKEGDVEAAAFERPHIVYRRNMAEEVRERTDGKIKTPEPVNDQQARAQAQAAKRRAESAQAEATQALIGAINPKTANLDQAVADVDKSEEQIKNAENGYRQQAEAEAKTVPQDEFPQRAKATIGIQGSKGEIVQNGKEMPFHYELLPLNGIQISHEWRGTNLVINPAYPESLQPRTISEKESQINDIRASRKKYDFRQYSDKTINGSMGPAIVDVGGRAVGGNTRLNIMVRHLQNLDTIEDPEQREIARMGFRSAMRNLAKEAGINYFPEDDQTYVVVRMLDKPIEDTREAAELGRLFNKKIGVDITKAAKGLSYSKSFTDPMLEEIGRRVEAYDGIIQAMNADPQYFADIVRNDFGVSEEEEADWFTQKDDGTELLSEAGRDQFTKAFMGKIITDTSVLNRIEGKTPYRALERSLGYILKMMALPDRNIIDKIQEAAQASADTQATDAILHSSHDKWRATYRPEQQELAGMETDTPPEPDRMVEALWRALHASDAAVPRVFNDRLKAFIGEESSKGGWIFDEHIKTPAEAFNAAFSKQLSEIAESRGDKNRNISQEEFDAALRGRELGDQEREDADHRENGTEHRRPETARLRKRIDEMTEAEKNAALLISRKTGLPNMTDFEEHNDPSLGGSPAIAIGMSDVDGLKAFNDKYGYDAGDKLLKAKADALRQVGVEAYHDKGDEYVYRSEDAEDLRTKLDRARGILRNTPIEVKDKSTGKTITYKGVDFSFGIGKDMDEAKEGQNQSKAARTAAGERQRGTFGRITRTPEIGEEGRSRTTPEPSAGGEQPPVPEFQKGKLARPPKAPTPEDIAARKIENEKESQGYVTPDQLKAFLEDHPATKDHAPELMRTAQLMAEYVYDVDPPEGVDRKEALDWILQERVARVERGELKTKRGQYTDPALEKGIGEKILRLHQAADPTTFIHEFGHVIFPYLSDADLRAIDTIGEHRVWDGKPSTLKESVYRDLSEKFSHGMERFLLNENPTGFSAEVKQVLAKLKEIMRKVYLAATRDPLSKFALTPDSREVFAKIFHITDFDVPDEWREEVKKARAQEKKMVKPEAAPHPVVKIARDIGAIGISDSIEGKVEDSAGDRVDPKKPVAVAHYPSMEAAVAAFADMGLEDSKIKGAELIHAKDDKWAIKFNTPTKVPKNELFQDLPVPERNSGLVLEDLEKRLKATPYFEVMKRKLLELQINNLKNRIRADHGVEERKPESNPELAKSVLEEKKNAKAAIGVRKADDARTGLQKSAGTGKIPKPPELGLFGHAATGAERGGAGRGKVAREPASLSDVTPVKLLPLTKERGTPVGTFTGEAYDSKIWTEGLKRAGLPENLPPPTVALSREVGEKLKYPGQKQAAQVALSALEQGDGVVLGNATGTGKTYLATGVIKEFRGDDPNKRILYITKNLTLKEKTKKVALNTFGYDIHTEVPPDPELKGVWAVSYVGLMNDATYKQMKWDLVVADESGEARNWFKEVNQQGKLLKEVIDNSKKAVYLSATPFHSPMEYGYLDKLNLWPKGGFDKWIQENFAHEVVDGKTIARLDPGKQAKLREQLIERGQFVSQAISYEGFTAHFGVVPVTDSMKRGLDRIKEGFMRAQAKLLDMGKKGAARKAAAFEATYTKAFLERERLPQAIELAKKAREQGWQVVVFSEHSAEDLFRRPRSKDIEPSTYQELDDEMGGTLSRIIPPFPDAFDQLRAEFGTDIGDYSGRGNTMAERKKALLEWQRGNTPILYSTYAAGGIGVDMHDADFPELDIKGGDKPRVFIFLGPPYSGVLLEQAMGRGWRFGVKSDVHVAFLATDSEPDIRLMTQKVGPRMKALRAAVLGENDSLAAAMKTYTDQDKVRERQDQLAYAEGNEEKVNAARFQVRSKTRQVGINDWSQINFPSAETAKNKGMKYGENVEGGDWSALFQAKFGMHQPPEPPEDAAGKKIINDIGNSVSSGRNVPPELQHLNPAERDTVVGLASATATRDVGAPVDRDKKAVARMSMEAELRNSSIIPYQGLTMSQELGIENIARLSGVPKAGLNLKLMNRKYRADMDMLKGRFWFKLENIFSDNGLKTDDATVKQVSLVLEGKASTTDEKIEKAAQQLSALFREGLGELVGAGVKLKTKSGERISYNVSFADPKYFPRRIDWEHEIVDPATGELKTLREIMKPNFDEEQRERMLKNVPELKPYSYQQVLSYLYGNNPKAGLKTHIHYPRDINFPFYKRDYSTLVGYFDQLAESASAARNFGSEDEKLNAEIDKIKSVNGRNTINSMFRSVLEPQSWDDWSAKVYNGAIAYEAASKMTFSAFKLPGHLLLPPLALDGRVMPFIKGAIELAMHPKDVMENAAMVGAITRQMSVADMLYGEHSSPVVRNILKKELFEWTYKMDRVIGANGAKVYLQQYAMNELRKGGDQAEHTRRLLRETFLISDHAIDQALVRGNFTADDLARGQTAFVNLTMFSDDPLQMPMAARMEISGGDPQAHRTLKRAVRLTYALKSFSIKATSLVREKLFDEMIVHHNFRMLPYILIASPIVGELMTLGTQGVKHGVQKGFEAALGKKHKQDSFDAHFERLKDLVKDPSALKAFKEYIDAVTMGWGIEIVKTLGMPLLDLATGTVQKSDQYWLPDLEEYVAGPFWSDVYKTMEEISNLYKIKTGKRNPGQKPQRYKKSIRNYLIGQLPALRNVPEMSEETTKPTY